MIIYDRGLTMSREESDSKLSEFEERRRRVASMFAQKPPSSQQRHRAKTVAESAPASMREAKIAATSSFATKPTGEQCDEIHTGNQLLLQLMQNLEKLYGEFPKEREAILINKIALKEARSNEAVAERAVEFYMGQKEQIENENQSLIRADSQKATTQTEIDEIETTQVFFRLAMRFKQMQNYLQTHTRNAQENKEKISVLVAKQKKFEKRVKKQEEIIAESFKKIDSFIKRTTESVSRRGAQKEINSVEKRYRKLTDCREEILGHFKEIYSIMNSVSPMIADIETMRDNLDEIKVEILKRTATLERNQKIVKRYQPMDNSINSLSGNWESVASTLLEVKTFLLGREEKTKEKCESHLEDAKKNKTMATNKKKEYERHALKLQQNYSNLKTVFGETISAILKIQCPSEKESSIVVVDAPVPVQRQNTAFNNVLAEMEKRMQGLSEVTAHELPISQTVFALRRASINKPLPRIPAASSSDSRLQNGPT